MIIRPYNPRGSISLLSHLRGVWRGVAFVVWTLSVGGAWLCLRPFVRGARRARGGALTLSLWSRGLCGLLGIRVAAEEASWNRHEGSAGKSALSAASHTPYLIVSNHIGYLDVIVLSALAGRRAGARASSGIPCAPALFVSKDDLAGWPVMGPLGRSVGTLFLDRTRPRAVAEVAAGMRAAFAQGLSVIVFPEGTTTAGDVVQPFHTALFEPALRAAIPVRGALLTYDSPDLAAWTGDASFVPHLYRLFCSRGLDVRVALQPEVVREGDRRAVAETIRVWMQKKLVECGSTQRAPVSSPKRSHFRRAAARFSLPRSGDRLFRQESP